MSIGRLLTRFNRQAGHIFSCYKSRILKYERYSRKKHSWHNHDVHFLAREINDWLPNGIRALFNGTYNPRFLTRLYLPDEIVDQLYLADRVIQNLLLKIIKPTFKYIINQNCYHMSGPTGVKYATDKITKNLEANDFKYFIRADIKSYYKSIVHFKLIDDIKKIYHDNKLINILTNIIKNPIKTAQGDINPDTGIALRGPLSQFFSAIYLKPLDDAIQKMDVVYLRYQDDILILLKTERQLKRCKSKMMKVLDERYLKLSQRKTCMGKIEQGFHFLGANYSCTQTKSSYSTKQVDGGGSKNITQPKPPVNLRITPHPRTIRKARENVRLMVTDGVSRPKIKSYLFRWLCWWSRASGEIWERGQLLNWFIELCRDSASMHIALEVKKDYARKLHT